MNKIIRKYIFVLTAIIMIITALPVQVSGASEAMEEYKKLPSSVLGVSCNGDTANFPENSIEAIESAISLGLDGVSVDVRKTKDGRFILMKDESLERMCGKDIKVSETDYDTLKGLKLRQSKGGPTQAETEYTVASLVRALEVTHGKIFLILDCQKEDFDKIYSVVDTYSSLDNVIIRSKQTDNDELIDWAESKGGKVEVMAYHRSNVIFRLISHFKKAQAAQLGCIQLATSNEYGVMFNSFFTKRLGETRGFFSFSDTEFCGERPDSTEGWENIIDSGYSVLETSNATGLASYLDSLEQSRYELLETYAKTEQIDLSSYTYNTQSNLTEALEKADLMLNSDKPSSASALSNANQNIKTALKNLEAGDSSSAKGEFKITLPRVLWTLFIVVLFVAAQMYIRKKTVKQK